MKTKTFKKTKQSNSLQVKFVALLVVLLFCALAIPITARYISRSTNIRSFAAIVPPKIEQVTKGEAGRVNSVKSRSVSATTSNFHLASISMKPYVPVTSVSGLGLKWTKVKAQCAARGATGTDVWMAVGNPTTTGAVTAAFGKSPENSVIAVTSLSGVYTDDPIANAIGFNTKGTDGSCTGGKDTDKYSLSLTTENNVIVLASMGIRLRTHTAGAPFTELIEFNYGSDNGDKAGLALVRNYSARSTQLLLNGKLNSETDWAGVVVQVQGFPERPTNPTSSPTAVPTMIPTSTPRPTTTAVPSSPTVTPTVRPTVQPTVVPSSTPLPPIGQVMGVWSSPTELRTKPMSGDAWNSVKATADSLSMSPNPDLDNQDDSTNVQVMAAAIVYARTGDTVYRTKVVNVLQKIEQFTPTGRTLAWARETGAYAISADLVGYRTAAFEKKMLDMAETYKCSQLNKTLLEMYKQRPNNWGSQAFGSLTAIYSYLGNTSRLQEVRTHYARAVNGPIPGEASFGSLSWQCSSSDPRWINKKGCSITCNGTSVNVDGIIPDDMRRGGSCQSSPLFTGYPWEGLQGFVMAARILDRAGMSIWQEGDQAICRAASALQEGRFGSGWRATGDDEWQIPFLDNACGKNWSAGYGSSKWNAGKNVGWGYVL
ncbi:hypothetical protein KBD71_02915 [Candidatus Woesebacteria bacterium]|nr:hypothetical protein [Candidatus Woesebacteria bacterium]